MIQLKSKTTLALFVGLGLSLNLMNGCGAFKGTSSQSITSLNNDQFFASAKAVLDQRCASCHNPSGSAANFQLSSTEEFIAAGLIVPGQPHRSKIIFRMQNFGNDPENNMPLGGPALEEAEFQLVYNWVAEATTGSSPFQCDGSDLNLAEIPYNDAKRLSNRQYRNTLVDLLSLAIDPQQAASLVSQQLDSANLPEDVGNDFDRENNQFENARAQAYFQIADLLAQALANNYRSQLIQGFVELDPGSCSNLNSNSPSNTCLDQFARNFASRAFRRPLRVSASGQSNSNGEPIDELSGLVSEFSNQSLQDGMSNFLLRVFLSPQFLFKVEDQNLLQPLAGQTETHRLSSFAIASRLSYRLWNTMPDITLWNLAANNDLFEDIPFSQAIGHIMSQDQKMDSSLREFFNNWLHLEDTPRFSGDPRIQVIAPNINLSEGLRRNMISEVEELGSFVTQENGSFPDLFLTDVAFARDPTLIQIYGMNQAAPSPINAQNAIRFPASERAGILTRAAFLISGRADHSHIMRGAHLRSDILCLENGAPPADALDQFSSVNVPAGTSTRQETSLRTSQPACVSCHSKINPLGFALGSYDAFGRFQQQEALFDGGSNDIHSYSSIDTQVDLSEDFGPGTQASGARELSQLVSQQASTRSCFSRKFFTYTFERPANDAADGCRLERIYNHLGDEGRLLDMVRSALLGQEMRLRRVEPRQ